MALGRAGAKVDAALLYVDLVWVRVLESAAEPTRTAGLDAYAQARRTALRGLEDLRIHREAVGLSNRGVDRV